MRAVVTYVHHNCFLLRLGDRLFLFDYPSSNHLPGEAAAVVRDRIREQADAALVIMISHSHEDHFDPAMREAVSAFASPLFIASEDVADMYPEALPPDALVLEPDMKATRRGLVVEALESNDLGVAFLISDGPVRLYFGGDLADWSWPSLPPAALQANKDFWEKALERVAAFKPHIAFSNVDNRLPNLAGGAAFVRTVAPRLFVPMHTFGDPSWLPEHRDALQGEKTKAFVYAKPGDKMEFEL